ncbi:hypothetical protein NHQ30_007386 [Ciborinia camelliae]|nr:hypothetical protein NHQ30_007386 [Ciborinia camelliae]
MRKGGAMPEFSNMDLEMLENCRDTVSSHNWSKEQFARLLEAINNRRLRKKWFESNQHCISGHPLMGYMEFIIDGRPHFVEVLDNTLNFFARKRVMKKRPWEQAGELGRDVLGNWNGKGWAIVNGELLGGTRVSETVKEDGTRVFIRMEEDGTRFFKRIEVMRTWKGEGKGKEGVAEGSSSKQIQMVMGREREMAAEGRATDRIKKLTNVVGGSTSPAQDMEMEVEMEAM